MIYCEGEHDESVIVAPQPGADLRLKPYVASLVFTECVV
jgi:hypothetical protein